MDSNIDLSSNKLTFYSSYSPSASKMPKHLVSSQAANKDPPPSVKKMRKEFATQAHGNKPCQTESCRGKLVSTGVNYEQPDTSSSSKTAPKLNQHLQSNQYTQSNQHSISSFPVPPPPASCYPPPSPPPSCYPLPTPLPSCYPPPTPPLSCYPPPTPPPSCYHPPPPCPRMMPESQHSQQCPQFYIPGPNRLGKSCRYRVPPPPCPYPLYPQYDMGAQHLNEQSMNDQEYDRDQCPYTNQKKQYGLTPKDSNEDAYDDTAGNGCYDENDIDERDLDYNNQYDDYNDDENYDPRVCSDCRLNMNDEEKLWKEQLNMQQRPHCSPPPTFFYYPPPPPPPPCPVPEMPQYFPTPATPKCCPARKRHCKKMQGGADMRNIGCDHCKGKPPNLECNHCKRKGERGKDCDHCKAKADNMECNHCKNKSQNQNNPKSPDSEYQRQYNKKPHKRQ